MTEVAEFRRLQRELTREMFPAHAELLCERGRTHRRVREGEDLQPDIPLQLGPQPKESRRIRHRAAAMGARSRTRHQVAEDRVVHPFDRHGRAQRGRDGVKQLTIVGTEGRIADHGDRGKIVGERPQPVERGGARTHDHGVGESPTQHRAHLIERLARDDAPRPTRQGAFERRQGGAPVGQRDDDRHLSWGSVRSVRRGRPGGRPPTPGRRWTGDDRGPPR